MARVGTISPTKHIELPEVMAGRGGASYAGASKPSALTMLRPMITKSMIVAMRKRTIIFRLLNVGFFGGLTLGLYTLVKNLLENQMEDAFRDNGYDPEDFPPEAVQHFNDQVAALIGIIMRNVIP